MGNKNRNVAFTVLSNNKEQITSEILNRYKSSINKSFVLPVGDQTVFMSINNDQMLEELNNYEYLKVECYEDAVRM